MEWSDEQVRLITQIMKGDIKQNEVREKLDDISKRYGEKAFNCYEVKRKPQETWSKEYLKDLEILSASGANSKEFYLYVAEVSDYLKQKENIPKQIAAILAAVISIIAIAKTIQRKKKNNNIDALVNELEDIKKELNDIKKIKEPTKKDIKRAEKLKVRADKIINRIKELKDKE